MGWSKESRHARGYGAEWDKLRKLVMARDSGMCQVCKAKRIVTPAKAVDHIVSKAKAVKLRWSQAQVDAMTNLQAICLPCHDEKSLAEQGKKTAKPVIGADGWPVERGQKA